MTARPELPGEVDWPALSLKVGSLVTSANCAVRCMYHLPKPIISLKVACTYTSMQCLQRLLHVPLKIPRIILLIVLILRLGPTNAKAEALRTWRACAAATVLGLPLMDDAYPSLSTLFGAPPWLETTQAVAGAGLPPSQMSHLFAAAAAFAVATVLLEEDRYDNGKQGLESCDHSSGALGAFGSKTADMQARLGTSMRQTC